MQNIDVMAWLVLRIVYAWMFLYPIPGLLKDWQTTVAGTSLLFPWFSNLFAIFSVAGMFVGSLSILLGFYAQIGGLILCLFSLGGAVVHYKLSKIAETATIKSTLSAEDVSTVNQLKTLLQVGHVTSAQKNIPLAAVGFFFFIMSAGPLSITSKILF